MFLPRVKGAKLIRTGFYSIGDAFVGLFALLGAKGFEDLADFGGVPQIGEGPRRQCLASVARAQ